MAFPELAQMLMDAAYKAGLCGQGWGMAGLTYFPLQNFSESLPHLALVLCGGGIGGRRAPCPHLLNRHPLFHEHCL